jgi:L-malate glycosyltransferase
MLTVFLATRNGAQTLPGVLEAFVRCEAPSGGWKLVVVDNGSTDRTREILHSFRASLPLTCVFEEQPGKNAALNTGLAHLEGDLALFTDDDVFPQCDWLIRLRAAADAQPSYAMFGGAILPRWEAEPPEWLSWVPAGPVLSLSDPGLAEGPTRPVFLFGANMAIRADIFQTGSRFDTSIGPHGANYPMGSETEFVERLARQGYRAWHARDAVVEHFIRAHQMDKAWVLGRAVRYGRGSFRRAKAGNPAVYPYVFGMPLRVSLKVCKPALRIAKAWLASDDRELFTARWDFNCFLGYTIEAFRLRHKDWIHVKAQALDY